MDKVFASLKQIFTLDIRALAFLRIGVGLLIILDLSFRLPDLRAHYANDGILPIHLLFSHLWNNSYLSLHTINGSIYFQGFLFIVSFISALHLVIGFHTRYATIISWVLLLSLHNRNPLILQGGDDLLRMLVFWGMFLPWDNAYSFDLFLKRINLKEIKRSVFSFATVGYILLIISVYFYSALLKSSPEWNRDFTALYYALSLDQMVFPLGKILHRYPVVMKILTMIVYYFELVVPLLLLFPFWNNTFRKVVIFSIVAFHVGISATLYVGLFFLIGIISLFGLFPKDWMDSISGSVRLKSFMIAHFLKKYVFISQVHTVKPLVNRRGYEGFSNSVTTFTLVCSICWNFQTVGHSTISCPDSLKWLVQVIRIDQHWGMFAPAVFKDDGWYIFEAKTASGELIDIRSGGKPVNYDKPASIVSSFTSDRWRKYSENFLFVSNGYIRPYYCDFIVKEWNDSNPENKIISLDIIYMKEVTLPDYSFSEPKKEILAFYRL